MIEHPRGNIEYKESGAGTTLVFVPGSFSTGASWRNISTPLSEGYRVVATSLSGYGATREFRQSGVVGMQDEMDILEAVIARANAPVHVVGHSFGAWVALFCMMRRKPKIQSLTLLEPTAFKLLKLAGETDLNQQVDAMTDTYFAGWRGGDRQAVRHVIDFYGGAGTFDGYPPPVQEKVIAQTPTNILDWETGYAEFPTLQEFATVSVPTLVICGNTSHAAMQRCNQLLVQCLPQAKLLPLEGANHFMMGTHPAELARLIDEHVGSV